MLWLWIGLAALLVVATAAALFHRHIWVHYLPYVGRIFQEKPLFIIPFGKPTEDAEEVVLEGKDGVRLHGCYLKAHAERRGVILFGIEFGSNCWSAIPYCDWMRESGYDIFAFETRGQGQSPSHNGYEPLQWVTEYELEDFRTAIAYLKGRPDADPKGIGLFGLSKGGSAGLLAAADDPYIRCFAVDGVFAVYTTMVPYMKKWICIYTRREKIAKLLPTFYYGYAARSALRDIERERGCTFPPLEEAMRKLAPRPLLMIHGGADNYIKPEMAQDLFDMAGDPKELWMVENAKHNQAIHIAGDDYKRRVLAFFDRHLGGGPQPEKKTSHPAAEAKTEDAGRRAEQEYACSRRL